MTHELSASWVERDTKMHKQIEDERRYRLELWRIDALKALDALGSEPVPIVWNHLTGDAVCSRCDFKVRSEVTPDGRTQDPLRCFVCGSHFTNPIRHASSDPHSSATVAYEEDTP